MQKYEARARAANHLCLSYRLKSDSEKKQKKTKGKKSIFICTSAHMAWEPHGGNHEEVTAPAQGIAAAQILC